MLLGALLGAALGPSSGTQSACDEAPVAGAAAASALLGADFCTGLRYWSAIEPTAVAFASRCAAPFGDPRGALISAAGRFGHPWPLPRVSYSWSVASSPSDESIAAPFLSPLDCRGKTSAIAELLSLLRGLPPSTFTCAPASLRFLRGTGPVVLLAPPGEAPRTEERLPPHGVRSALAAAAACDADQPWWPILAALRDAWRARVGGDAAGRLEVPLDKGVAAADRAEVQRLMARGVPPGPATAGAGGAVSGQQQREPLDAALVDPDSTTNRSLDNASSALAPSGAAPAGTGQFFFWAS